MSILKELRNENKTKLTLLNGTGYVFDVDDYMDLRMHHRIIGSFVGSTTEPNGFGLPAELSPQETRLLVEEGIALLVSKSSSLLREPTPAEKDAYKVVAEARLTAQAELLKRERLRDAERNIDNIVAGKRKKLERAGQPTVMCTQEVILKEIADQFVFERNNALVEITCAHGEDHEAHIVLMPSPTPSDSLKYRVFHKYWKDGKYVTPGDAFGADFLIYPGDPIIYHATHIVIVLEAPTQVDLLNIISKVRLGVVVNKSCVIAYTNEKNSTDGPISYQTIVWDGNNDIKTAAALENVVENIVDDSNQVS